MSTLKTETEGTEIGRDPRDHSAVCPTCQCNDPSSLTAFNTRCRRVLAMQPLALPDWLAGRLSEAHKYQFGFREFIGSCSTSALVGVFLAAVAYGPQPPAPAEGASIWDLSNYDIGMRNWRSGRRLFACLIPPPWSTAPRPREYNSGDQFDLSDGQVYGEMLGDLAAWPDDVLLNWLDQSRLALREFVVSRCRPEELV